MDRRVKERLVGATILVVLIVLIVPALLSGPKVRVPPPSAAGPAGPAEPIRNVTVDLATSKATPAQDPEASAASLPAHSTTVGAKDPGDAATGDAAAPGEALAAESAPGEAPAGLPAATSGVTRVPAPPTIATLKAQQPAHSSQPVLESEPSAPRSASKGSKPGYVSETAPAGASNHHWAVQLGSFAGRANAEKLVRQLKSRDASLYVSSSGKGPSLRYRVRIGPLADRDAAERVVAKLKKEGRSASLVPP